MTVMDSCRHKVTKACNGAVSAVPTSSKFCVTRFDFWISAMWKQHFQRSGVHTSAKSMWNRIRTVQIGIVCDAFVVLPSKILAVFGQACTKPVALLHTFQVLACDTVGYSLAFRGFQHSVGLIVVFYCESGRGWNQALFAINVFQEWNLHWVWVRTEWSHRAFWSKQGLESRVKWFCCDVRVWMLKTVETHWKNLKNTHCIFGLGDSWRFHRKGLQWRHFSRAHQLKISRDSVCILDFQHWCWHKVPCETAFELQIGIVCDAFVFLPSKILAVFAQVCTKPVALLHTFQVLACDTVGYSLAFRGFQHSVGLIVVFYCESGRGWNQALFAINVFQEWNLHWVWVRTEWSHRAFWSKQGLESRVKWFCCDVRVWMLKTVETHWKNLKNTHCIFGLGDSWRFHRKGLQWRHFSRAHQLKISRNSVCVLDFCNVESTFPTQCCWQKVQSPYETAFEPQSGIACDMFSFWQRFLQPLVRMNSGAPSNMANGACPSQNQQLCCISA